MGRGSVDVTKSFLLFCQDVLGGWEALESGADGELELSSSFQVVGRVLVAFVLPVVVVVDSRCATRKCWYAGGHVRNLEAGRRGFDFSRFSHG